MSCGKKFIGKRIIKMQKNRIEFFFSHFVRNNFFLSLSNSFFPFDATNASAKKKSRTNESRIKNSLAIRECISNKINKNRNECVASKFLRCYFVALFSFHQFSCSIRQRTHIIFLCWIYFVCLRASLFFGCHSSSTCSSTCDQIDVVSVQSEKNVKQLKSSRKNCAWIDNWTKREKKDETNKQKKKKKTIDNKIEMSAKEIWNFNTELFQSSMYQLNNNKK